MRRRKPNLAPRTLGEIERHLVRNFESFNPFRVDRITKLQIAAELKSVTAKSGPIQANRTVTSLHGFFEWCIGEGYTDVNPAVGLNKNPETARDRVLSVSELAKVSQALSPTPGDYSDIVHLLVFEGPRADEIGSLRWSEVDLESAIVTLPPARTKNRRQHSFPLSAPALAILKRRWDARRDDCDLVFGRGKGSKGFSGWSRAKARLDAKLDLEPWVIHDLRRSFSTGLGDLGAPPHVIEMLLNHQSGTKAGVAGVYNLSRYEKEAREAVELWGETVMAAVRAAEKDMPIAAE